MFCSLDFCMVCDNLSSFCILFWVGLHFVSIMQEIDSEEHLLNDLILCGVGHKSII